MWQILLISTAVLSFALASVTTDGRLCVSTCKKWPGRQRNECFTTINRGYRYEKCTPTRSIIEYYDIFGHKCEGTCAQFTGDYEGNPDHCFTPRGTKNQCSQPKISSSHLPCISDIFPPKNTGEAYKCSVKYNGQSSVWQDSVSPPPRLVPVAAQIDAGINRDFGIFVNDQFVKCSQRRYRRQANVTQRLLDLHRLVELAENEFGNAVINRPNNPVVSVVQVEAPTAGPSTSRPVLITVAMRAIIRYSHLRTRDTMPPDVDEHMRALDKVRGDEAGHLLASSFSGPSELYNLVPQSPIVNRNEHTASGATSYWSQVEREIRNFLRAHPDGSVEWVVLVGYGDLPASRRPTGFRVGFITRLANGSEYGGNTFAFINYDDSYLPTNYCQNRRRTS